MKIFHHVDKIDIEKDLWQVLAEANKPIVMYGMGNGADKILDVFSKRGISVADFFASDGFVRYKQFHGKTVVSMRPMPADHEVESLTGDSADFRSIFHSKWKFIINF